jgi:hypothetical protein
MTAVTAALVRAYAGIDSGAAPADATITDALTNQAQVLAETLGKSAIDYSNCTASEAEILKLRTAAVVILTSPLGTDSYQAARAAALNMQANTLLAEMTRGSGKIFVDILGVNIPR